MTENKDFKRLVRARMERTGESYTTARTVLVERRATELPADLGSASAISESSVKKATGMSWREWVDALDRIDAIGLPHREIAKHIGDNYPDVSAWWAQNVTVGYERIRGLRDVGQRRSGTYDVNKSKTLAVPVARLYAAFADAKQRAKWLPGADPETRTEHENKSIRWTWDDGSPVDCYFTAKGDARSSVQIQHRGHSTKADADDRRALWTERLAALGDILT